MCSRGRDPTAADLPELGLCTSSLETDSGRDMRVAEQRYRRRHYINVQRLELSNKRKEKFCLLPALPCAEASACTFFALTASSTFMIVISR